MKTQIDQLKNLMAKSGFTLSEPDVLQPAALFYDQAGEDIGQRLFVTQGASGQELCLRPEFTLPLVQAHLARRTLPKTAAYSYVGNVFRQRDDAPEEFLQAGVEIIGGTSRLETEKKLISFALDALTIFNVTEPRIRIGDVALFEKLLAKADMPAAWRTRIRHRFGTKREMADLLKRLGSKPKNRKSDLPRSKAKLRNLVEESMALNGLSPTQGRTADEITQRMIEKQKLAAEQVPEQTVALIKAYLKIKGKPATCLKAMRALFAKAKIDMDKPLAAFEKQCASLNEAAGKTPITFDAGFGRRLDYYSGLVFEISDKSLPLEPLVGGGRYDRLMTRMGATKPTPAIGCSIWLDRLQKGQGA